jgi:two-component system, sensor histidine kinase and response regulator
MSTIPDQQFDTVKILVVEDSPTQSMLLQNILEKHGYQVSVARNGREALASLRDRKPTMVISDINMPEMDGYQLCNAIKTDEQLRDLPVMLLTSLSAPQDIVRGLECGADNFVVKPYEETFLISRIHFILANQELRTTAGAEMGITVFFAGQKYFITADRLQILNLLLSTYETAVQRNTELTKAREELETKAQELTRSNNELEQFAYVVSHDLQEPLRMVGSYLALIEKRYSEKLDDKAHEFIGFAVDGAKRMQRLIQDLLTYSRVGTRGKPFAPTKCEEVLAAALANLQVAIEESHAAVTHDPLPTVDADETQLLQLFQNLIGNALKFCKDKAPAIHVSAKQQAERWLFSVRDNGIGIEPQHYERIFVVFQRLHGREEYPGTGIGLAVCKKIVERHGGRIWVESQPGQGSTFFFRLPSRTEKAE